MGGDLETTRETSMTSNVAKKKMKRNYRFHLSYTIRYEILNPRRWKK